jgi:hypothetical protein
MLLFIAGVFVLFLGLYGYTGSRAEAGRLLVGAFVGLGLVSLVVAAVTRKQGARRSLAREADAEPTNGSEASGLSSRWAESTRDRENERRSA